MTRGKKTVRQRQARECYVHGKLLDCECEPQSHGLTSIRRASQRIERNYGQIALKNYAK